MHRFIGGDELDKMTHQVLGSDGLCYVTIGAIGNRYGNAVHPAFSRQHDNGGFGIDGSLALPDLAEKRESVDRRHEPVAKDHIGLQVCQMRKGFRDAFRLYNPAHAEAAQDVAKQFADEGVVVDQQNGKLGKIGLLDHHNLQPSRGYKIDLAIYDSQRESNCINSRVAKPKSAIPRGNSASDFRIQSHTSNLLILV